MKVRKTALGAMLVGTLGIAAAGSAMAQSNPLDIFGLGGGAQPPAPRPGVAPPPNIVGSTSVSGTASTNYAAAGSAGSMDLIRLRTMPKVVPAFPVELKGVSNKFYKGRTK